MLILALLTLKKGVEVGSACLGLLAVWLYVVDIVEMEYGEQLVGIAFNFHSKRIIN